MSSKLTLLLDPEQVEAFCQRLVRHGGNPEQALAGLTTLQSFIASTTGPAEQATATYLAIRRSLDLQLEEVRARLLAEVTKRLAAALRSHDVASIAAIYRPLSRSGFWSALESVAARLTPDAIHGLSAWASGWIEQARAAGEAASGYPDALDFERAGISVEAYVAMGDIARFLQGR